MPDFIKSDEKRFKQILYNLIGNALKFTFKGGIKVNVTYNEISCRLLTSVVDTGIGIKPEDMEHLFKFFGKVGTKAGANYQSGMGFGLTISKMIANQLKGSIKAKSVYSQGSTFMFEIQTDN